MSLYDAANTESLSGRDRSSCLKSALPNAEIRTEKTSGYQGDIYIYLELNGSHYLINDYYGSCSGCDRFLNDRSGWLEDQLKNVREFSSRLEAVKFLLRDDKGYSWSVANTDDLINKIYGGSSE